MCILLGKRPSKGKRKSEDNEKPAPKLKKRKVVMASVPLDATIINIDDDSDGVPPSNPTPANVASSSSTPIFIASSLPQGSEQSSDSSLDTSTFTSEGPAESSSAASPSASPVPDPSVSNREPAPSSEPATANEPASEPAASNEHAISNEPSTPTTSNPPATSENPGLDLEKTSGVMNEASDRITRRSHRANVLYEF